MDVSILILLCTAVVIAIVYFMPYIKKLIGSKWNISGNLVTLDKIIELLQLLMKDSGVMPKEQELFVSSIAETIQKAIEITQKMYEGGQCTKEERAKKAFEIVIDMANIANCPLTEQQKTIVTKTIGMLLLLMN